MTSQTRIDGIKLTVNPNEIFITNLTTGIYSSFKDSYRLGLNRKIYSHIL